jgi:hypothetical protein
MSNPSPHSPCRNCRTNLMPIEIQLQIERGISPERLSPRAAQETGFGIVLTHFPSAMIVPLAVILVASCCQHHRDRL